MCYLRVLLGCESIGIIILPRVPLLAARERSSVEMLLDASSPSAAGTSTTHESKHFVLSSLNQRGGKQKQRVVSPHRDWIFGLLWVRTHAVRQAAGALEWKRNAQLWAPVGRRDRLVTVPEWLLLLPIWLSDWLWATCGRSWQDWMGEPWPEGATLGAFSMFFISISSWWIQRSGGLRSFWLPFLLLALWLALFLHTGAQDETDSGQSETLSTTRLGFNIHMDALSQVGKKDLYDELASWDD